MNQTTARIAENGTILEGFAVTSQANMTATGLTGAAVTTRTLSNSTLSGEGSTSGSLDEDTSGYVTMRNSRTSSGKVFFTSVASKTAVYSVSEEPSSFTPTDSMERIPGLTDGEIIAIIVSIVLLALLVIMILIKMYRRQKRETAPVSSGLWTKYQHRARDSGRDLDFVLPDTLRFGVFEPRVKQTTQPVGNFVPPENTAIKSSNGVDLEYTSMKPDLLKAPTTKYNTKATSDYVIMAPTRSRPPSQHSAISDPKTQDKETLDPRYVQLSKGNVDSEAMYVDMNGAAASRPLSNYVTMEGQNKSTEECQRRIYVNLSPHGETVGRAAGSGGHDCSSEKKTLYVNLTSTL